MARRKYVFLENTTNTTQAERLFSVFGGACELLRCLKDVGQPRHRSTIYKWNAPKSVGGTGGVVPTSVWPDIIQAARYAGVFLRPELFDVRQSRKLEKKLFAFVLPTGEAYAVNKWKEDAALKIEAKKEAKKARKKERSERLKDDIFS